MDWIDAINEGILYFGIHLTYLPRQSIKFDTCDMKYAISRRTISYVRTFVLSQSTEFIEKFKNHLHTFWGQFNVLVCLNNKPFSSFQGNELAKWVGNIPLTIAILRDTFEDTEHNSNMCQLLQLWNSLTKFLGMTKILMSKEMYM